jgi:hypothetical protein
MACACLKKTATETLPVQGKKATARLAGANTNRDSLRGQES